LVLLLLLLFLLFFLLLPVVVAMGVAVAVGHYRSIHRPNRVGRWNQN
jgi:hypothetical protein